MRVKGTISFTYNIFTPPSPSTDQVLSLLNFMPHTHTHTHTHTYIKYIAVPMLGVEPWLPYKLNKKICQLI
uniref:Uncharacterized protein n=1 Tax=Octopus bimaculoides TaxID=37653 RepID=A0A0L8H4P2_OCTBM